MNESLSNPVYYVLDCCERGTMPTKFDILDAKNQLRKTKDQIDGLISCYQNTRVIGREDRAKWLSVEQDRAKLSEENKVLQETISRLYSSFAWATTVSSDSCTDKQIMLPLYSNKEEMKKVVDGLKERLTS